MKKIEKSEPKKKIKKKIEQIPNNYKDIKNLPKDSLSHILSKRIDLNEKDFKPKVAVIGVGGGGGNAVNAVIENEIKDVLTINYNTDAQVLKYSKADIKMHLGPTLTKGHGAGANPQVGKLAAQESEEEIKKHLTGVHVAFIVAGMGGGTGTGAGPEIAKIALEKGILTIGLVTTPFDFEGDQRKKAAQKGLEEFQNNCDVLIVIGNQNLFSLANEETTFLNAFELTDQVLCSGLKSFIQTIKEPSRINVDVSDFFTIMKGKKSRARMGTGFAEGEEKGIKAAQEAMASPLLELGGIIAKDVDGVIICIRCGNDMTLNDINQAVEHIRSSVSEKAQIIFGATVDEKMKNKVQISIFATTSIKDDDDDETPQIEEKNKEEFNNTINATFDDLINTPSEEDLIGKPHSNMINEDHQQFTIREQKPSILKRFFNFILRKKKKKVPPYLED